MFGFRKKKEAGAAEVVPQTIAEEMGLREYVSVDSLKAQKETAHRGQSSL